MFIKKSNNVSTIKNGGISAHFSKTLNQIIKSDISTLLIYLRKRFVFPVKCNLYLCDKEFFISQKDGLIQVLIIHALDATALRVLQCIPPY